MLSELLATLRTKESKKIHYVLSNTSCDMDSVLCAIILSFAKNVTFKILKFSEESGKYEITGDVANKVYLPIINCKRGELKTRLDIAYMFKMFKVDPEVLSYITDDDVVKHLHSGSNFKIIMVDHNALDPNQMFLADYVEEMYDHHDDNKQHISYKNLKYKMLKVPLGSCSTLIIADYYLSQAELRKNFSKYIDPMMLVTAILQDTNNFLPASYKERWVDFDRFVVHSILGDFIGKDNITPSLDKYFKELSDCKYDEATNLDLGVDGLMNKDMKSFKFGNTEVEWSSLPIPTEKIIGKYGLDNVGAYFNGRPNVHYHILLANRGEDQNKGLVFYIKNDYLDKFNIDNLSKFLKDEMLEKFIDAKHLEKNVAYITVDSSSSRKTLEPVIRKYFEQT